MFYIFLLVQCEEQNEIVKTDFSVLSHRTELMGHPRIVTVGTRVAAFPGFGPAV